MQANHVFPITRFAGAIAKCMPSVIVCVLSREEIIASLDILKNIQFEVDEETKSRLVSNLFPDGAYAVFTRKRSNVIISVFADSQYHVGEYKLKDTAVFLASLPKDRFHAIKRSGVVMDVNVKMTAEFAASVLSA